MANHSKTKKTQEDAGLFGPAVCIDQRFLDEIAGDPHPKTAERQAKALATMRELATRHLDPNDPAFFETLERLKAEAKVKCRSEDDGWECEAEEAIEIEADRAMPPRLRAKYEEADGSPWESRSVSPTLKAKYLKTFLSRLQREERRLLDLRVIFFVRKLAVATRNDPSMKWPLPLEKSLVKAEAILRKLDFLPKDWPAGQMVSQPSKPTANPRRVRT